ncbi:MAG: T9SS type A sorting domain-containing protein [candidate division Zixibacteria bacterium]|nr:T9SS type A sorting domain-containing protein [candidate division Zixibacteria bacterium]
MTKIFPVLGAAILMLMLIASASLAIQDEGLSTTAKVYKQGIIENHDAVKFLNGSNAWRSFKNEYGEDTWVRWNVNSGTPHRVVTSGINLAPALNEDNIEELSRRFINNHPGVFGVNSSELRLQSAGFHGKMWHAVFKRYYNGLPVYNGLVRMSYASNGALVSFGADTYPDIDINTTPALSLENALRVVISDLPAEYANGESLQSQLIILPLQSEQEFSVHLAYEIVYYSDNPVGRWFYYIDAHTGAILMRWDGIAREFGGRVTGDIQWNGDYTPFDNEPFKDLTVNASGYGSDETNSSGYYSISGSGSATITAYLEGPWVDVINNAGPSASFSGTSYGNLDIDFTGYSDPAETNGYFHTITAHDYIKYVDPPFTGVDYSMNCNVNVYGSCNAYWDGSSINFYREGGGCGNTAQMATVVHHEYGHGITEFYYYPETLPYWDETGGLNEGWSDFIANCITDQPLMGRGWSGSGTYLRSSDNNAQYPGTECNGEPHCMGDIMVGALWDMRVNLVNTHGNGIKTYVDSLWHHSRAAKPMSYEDYLWELLLYDDNDGNPLNGTPNYADICDGFARHNMDCPELQVGVFITHTPLGDTPSTQSYQVDAIISSTEGNIDSTFIYWSNGGGFNPVEMSNISGNNYRGFIPGQSQGTFVDYYLYATDDAGYNARNPESGYHTFYVGVYDTVFADDIENGNQGWTHSAVTGGYYDDWGIRTHRNHTPDGDAAWKFGSETSGGTYTDNGDGGLVTPVVTLPEGATLTFWMWGEIEESGGSSAWDGAMVEMSIDSGPFNQITPAGGYTHTTAGGYSHPWPQGTPCWSGNFNWTEVEFDLSDYAFENVQIRFRFGSDSYVSYEGWYIDDVAIWGAGQVQEPDISIEMIPNNPPVTVQPGGYFRFTGILNNNTQDYLQTDVWVMLQLPGGSQYGPVQQYNNVFMSPGQNITVSNIRQDVPVFAPLGAYDYISYCGGYPSSKIDSSSFEFTVVPGSVQEGSESWLLSGWFGEDENLPEKTELSGNNPNPFNPATTINYSLTADERVNISVYNMMGQKIATLVDEVQTSGFHTISWDGLNDNGARVATGVYFYRMTAGDYSMTKKMTLLK